MSSRRRGFRRDGNRARDHETALPPHDQEGGSMAKPIPEGYRTVTPYLVFDDAAAAIEFYKRRVRREGAHANGGARRQDRARGDRDRRLDGDALRLVPAIDDEVAERDRRHHRRRLSLRRGRRRRRAAGRRRGGNASRWRSPTSSGAIASARSTDPFGHSWSIATHVEDVPPEEIAERAKEAMAAMSSS